MRLVGSLSSSKMESFKQQQQNETGVFYKRGAIGSEDIVCCKVGSTFKFGVVTQAYNDETSSSESEDEDDEDHDEKSDKVKEGYAKVAWFNVGLGEGYTKMLEAKNKKGIEEQVVPERKLKLVDRALMPGDAVRRLNLRDCQTCERDSKPQRGFVKNVKLMFDVAMISNRDLRLYNVPASRFSGPVPYSVGCFCVYNFYLGEIDSVNNTVRIELRNGFVYEVKESILRRYSTDVHDPVEKYSYFHKSFFYPSQQLKVNARALENAVCVLASAHRQEDLKKEKFLKAQVVSVFTNSVKISWILRCFSGNSGNGAQSSEDETVPPKTLYNPQLKKLQILTDYIYLSYSLGDKAMLKLTESDLREIEKVDSNLHCGGDIKDHIIDMKVKQMCRNKYGGRFHRKKPTSKRVYHSAEVLPDSLYTSKVAIGRRPRSVFTPDDVMNSFNVILDLNKINRRDENVLKSVASQSSFYISETFQGKDFPATIVELLTTLRDRNQLREHDLVKFFLNRRPKMPYEQEGYPFQQQSAVALVRCFVSPSLIESGSNFSKTKCEMSTIKLNPMNNEEHIAGLDYDEANVNESIESENHSEKELRKIDFSNGKFDEAEDLPPPVFDSTVDLAMCISSMLNTWDDVMHKRNPNWNTPDFESEFCERAFDDLDQLQNAGNDSETDGETETVSTFETENDDNIGVIGDSGLKSVNGQSADQNRSLDSNEHNKTANTTLTRSISENGIPPKNIRSLKAGDFAAFKIIMTRTLVTVMWQDGSLEEDIPSTEVETLHHLDENEFFPGDFVVDTRKESSGLELYGVVQNADFLERVCTVRWFSDAANDRRALLSEEQVSVYDISDLEHLDLNVLDIVARISGEDERPLEEGDECVETFGRGTAGAVIDVQLSTGLVLVLWVEGYRSLVPHHCLININDSELVSDLMDDDDTTSCSSEEDAENGSEDGSWTTASDDGTASDLHPEDDAEESVDSEIASSPIAKDQVEAQLNEPNEEPDSADDIDLSSNMTKMKVAPTKLDFVDPPELARQVSSPASPGAAKVATHLSRKFPRFDCLPSVRCHRFIASSEIPHSKLFLSTLKKELKVLSTALPDGIFVRTFEDRNDLFSCLIVGAEGTPYEQGLFIFDIKLPMHYPMEPPEVLYLSYASGKLNPNLYEDGKICLSLLGTWSGKGTEVWSKDSSSLLQVFVSLQALILNKTPYFNEAGYEKQRSMLTGQENAKMYNEMVVLRLVEACTAMIIMPYETFEKEILEHFEVTGSKLIDRLQVWCDTQDSSQIPSPSFPLFPLSTGFRNSLVRELNKFKTAVSDKFGKSVSSSGNNVEKSNGVTDDK